MRLSPVARLRAPSVALVLVAGLVAPAFVRAGVVIATADSVTTKEDHAVVVSVLANDTGIGLAVTAATDAANGTTVISGAGTTVTYTPDPDAHGSDTFQYTASDGAGGSGTATVTVTVNPVNDPPTAGNDPSAGCNPAGAFGGNFPIPEDYGVITMLSGSGACSLDANDRDVDGDELTYQLVSGPAHASTFVFDPDGSYQYRPVSDYSTNEGNWDSDAFSYRVSDGTTWSAPATMRFWIAQINDAPTFNLAAQITVAEDVGAVSRNAFATLISPGPASESNQTVTFQVTANAPDLFAVQPGISSTGRLTFTPKPDANGLATVTVVAKDNGGLEDYDVATVAPDDTSDPKTFQLVITPVDDPPAAIDDEFLVQEDTRADLPVTWNDGHVDGTAFSITAATDGAKGDAAVVAGTGISYTPHADANGTDTFTYTLTDADGDTDTATVTLTIEPVNDPPTFTPGSNVTVAEDAGPRTIAGWATAIKVGPPDEALTQTPSFTITGNTNPGLFSTQPAVAANGTLTFTSQANANGSSTLTIQLSDGALTTAATRTITVTPVNDPPSFTASSDVAVGEDVGARTFAGWATDISVGPPDETATQSPTFTVTENTNPGIFSVVPAVSASGTLTFTPKPNASGVAAMTVTLSDGVATTSRPLTITIVPGADPPNAVNDVGITVPALSGATAIPVLANDLDPDPGESLTIIAVTQGTKGHVAITGGGTGITYAPRGCSVGTDTFTYTIRDSAGGTDTASVLLTIERDRVQPTAATPGATFIAGSTLGNTAVPVRVTWCATDPGSGIARYHVVQSTDLRPYETVRIAPPAATSAVRSMGIGHRYRFKVRGVDGDGSVGAFATGPLWAVGRTQESSAAITYSAGWRTVTSTSASGGRVRTTSTAGATATIAFEGRAIALVGPVSSTRGSFRVFIDDELVALVSERASSGEARRIVFARTVIPGAHTLRIEAVGNGRIDLDAVLTLS
jgi:hypothetical protein